MTRQAHLVGSVGLRDVETVLRTVSESLRPGCPRNNRIDLEKKVEALTRELGEALEQQLATSTTNGRVNTAIGHGIEPFQLMINAKELPTVEFADYTFVFH